MNLFHSQVPSVWHFITVTKNELIYLVIRPRLMPRVLTGENMTCMNFNGNFTLVLKTQWLSQMKSGRGGFGVSRDFFHLLKNIHYFAN